MLKTDSTATGPHTPEVLLFLQVVIIHSRRLQVLDLLNRGCLTVLNLLLVDRALRVASLDSGGAQMCPRNDDEFLSALSTQDVEIEISKYGGLIDEQYAMTSWHLQFGLANRPFAVVDKPDESAHRPSKARHLLKHVSSNQIGRSGVGQSPTHAPQFSSGEINSRAQSRGSDDVITEISDTIIGGGCC